MFHVLGTVTTGFALGDRLGQLTGSQDKADFNQIPEHLRWLFRKLRRSAKAKDQSNSQIC